MKEKSRIKVFSVILVLLVFSVVMVVGVMYDQSFLNNEESVDSPTFFPSINDKMSYEEQHRLMENYTSTAPLTESEIIKIIFAEKWLFENDRDNRQEIIHITFPVDWNNDRSLVSDDEPIAVLRVPEKMLELDDLNSNPKFITVSYPIDTFEFYPNITVFDLKVQEEREKTERS